MHVTPLKLSAFSPADYMQQMSLLDPLSNLSLLETFILSLI